MHVSPQTQAWWHHTKHAYDSNMIQTYKIETPVLPKKLWSSRITYWFLSSTVAKKKHSVLHLQLIDAVSCCNGMFEADSKAIIRQCWPLKSHLWMCPRMVTVGSQSSNSKHPKSCRNEQEMNQVMYIANPKLQPWCWKAWGTTGQAERFNFLRCHF